MVKKAMEVKRMNETVKMQVEKQETDEQWNEYHEGQEREERKPTEKQIAYIVALSRAVGMKVNTEKIGSNSQASALIEKLKLINQRINGNGGTDLRDKRVAFGLATKLISRRYADKEKDFKKSRKFWQDVRSFYEEYLEQQEQVVLGVV